MDEPGTARSSGAHEQPWSVSRHTGRIRQRMRRHWRRLGFRRQFIGVVVLAALLSSVVSTSVGYFVLRASALDAAQARTVRDLRVAWQVLRDQGASLALRQGELYAGTGSTSAPLNGDTALVSTMSAATSDQASLYAVEGGQLVPVASSVATAPQSALNGPAYQALLGNCLQAASAATCAQTYAGTIQIGGVDSIAALMPLQDASGADIGALGVYTPVDAVLAPVRQLIQSLMLVGLALTGLVLILGMRLAGPVERRAFAALTLGLDQLGEAAVHLESSAGAQIARSARQADVARHLIEEVRQLGEVAVGLERSVSLLRQTAGDMWAEASTPGASGSPDTSAANARQAAITASQVSNAAEHANQLCYRLRARANLVIAEADVLATSGREAQAHAADVRGAILRVEDALGEHVLATRPEPAGDMAPDAGAYDTRPTDARARRAIITGRLERPPSAGANSAADQIHIAIKHPRGVRPGASSGHVAQRFGPPPAQMPPQGAVSGPMGGAAL